MALCFKLNLCFLNSCENFDDRYQTIFHPVALDDRVQYPSHIKRFGVNMFTFVKDDTVLRDQVRELNVVQQLKD